MTIQELFIRSNHELMKVVDQIKDDQWGVILPDYASMNPSNLLDAVRYHIYDDAWVPDVLAGKTAEEVGDAYDSLKNVVSDNVKAEYAKYNQRACASVEGFSDLEREAHLSYGDFKASEYLQHVTSFRAIRAYDLAKLIGVDSSMDDEYAQALMDEYTSHIQFYRQVGVFPAAVEVPTDADLQTRLLGMFGRQA